MKRLQGKVCVVTAAGQGIGRAIAENFHREGAIVIAVDRCAGAMERWTNELGIECVVLDATDENAVSHFSSQVSQIDALVNCVGIVAEGTILESNLSDLGTSFNVNVGSMHLMIKQFLPIMLSQKQGSIINIASVVSSIKAAPNRYIYATTKAAVLGLTKSVARDYIHLGIRCNSISPGTVESPSLHQRMAAKGDPEKSRAEFIARQPMGRLGQPEEIANIAVLLASDEARFMTGENIVIDGGMSL